MKFTQTGFPRRLARSIVPPPTWGTTRAGAGSPTWNRPAADPVGPPEPPGLGGTPEPDAVGDSDPSGDGERIAIDPDGTGGGVAEAPGSGAKARIPPSTSSATATPASRPARIDKRGHMVARRVPVRTVESVPAVLPLRFRSHARRLGLLPDPIAARRADRGRRHAACCRPADLHGPGRRGTSLHALTATDRVRGRHAVPAHHAPAARIPDARPAVAESRP